MKRKIRVLGVDPAAAGPTGYGVVEADGRGCRALCFGALPRQAGVAASRRRGSVAARLRAIHALVSQLVEEYAPDAVAIESVFAALNRKTALQLAEVRGVILLAAAQNGVPVHSYAPREVKANVTGYGQADKRQVQQMVRALLGLRQAPEPADASDALAVALCHIQTAEARARFAAATRPVLPASAGRKAEPQDAPGSHSRSARIEIPR